MSVINDDGLPLDLHTVFILFLMPNITLIILTTFGIFLLYISKKHPGLKKLLSRLANSFAKGALHRIVRNMLRHFQLKKTQNENSNKTPEQRSLKIPRPSHLSASSSANFSFEKRRDANYILLIPFQLDLLLTVVIYKILTRDVYFETCQSYLTTYHNRPTQVVCWLKNTNKNISNLSTNITLYQYCTNQTITYINYEHTDVICIQYVFKLINIIDTVTNIFAWHQAIVFVVTKFIVFSYWYQHKLRETLCWINLSNYQHRMILFIIISLAMSIYIFFFVLILPIWFLLTARKRVDLTHHLIYACAKFIVAIIVQVNIYTLYQWHLHITQVVLQLPTNKEEDIDYDQSTKTYTSPSNAIMLAEHSNTSSKKYSLTDLAVYV